MKHDIFVLKSFLMVAENKFCFTVFFHTEKKFFLFYIIFWYADFLARGEKLRREK